jgi:hypothetical protein
MIFSTPTSDCNYVEKSYFLGKGTLYMFVSKFPKSKSKRIRNKWIKQGKGTWKDTGIVTDFNVNVDTLNLRSVNKIRGRKAA